MMGTVHRDRPGWARDSTNLGLGKDLKFVSLFVVFLVQTNNLKKVPVDPSTAGVSTVFTSMFSNVSEQIVTITLFTPCKKSECVAE